MPHSVSSAFALAPPRLPSQLPSLSPRWVSPPRFPSRPTGVFGLVSSAWKDTLVFYICSSISCFWGAYFVRPASGIPFSIPRLPQAFSFRSMEFYSWGAPLPSIRAGRGSTPRSATRPTLRPIFCSTFSSLFGFFFVRIAGGFARCMEPRSFLRPLCCTTRLRAGPSSVLSAGCSFSARC